MKEEEKYDCREDELKNPAHFCYKCGKKTKHRGISFLSGAEVVICKSCHRKATDKKGVQE